MGTQLSDFIDSIRSIVAPRTGNTNRGSLSPGRVVVLPLLLVALSIGGCDMLGSESSDEGPEIDETLEPGGTAVTEAGVRLMASSEALEESVSVSAQKVPESEVETLMPEATSAVGSYYRVSGERNLDKSSQSSPLYVALPVPEETDPSNLALGVRIPRSYVTDTDESSPEYGWSLVRGAYEPERSLLVVPTHFLASDGIVLSVVRSAEYDAPTMEDAEGETLFEKTQNFFSVQKEARKAKNSASFKVKCKGFSGGDCGSSEKKDVRNYLNDAYNDFVSGFREPDLRTPLLSDKYIWTIKKKGTTWCKGDTAGKYLSLTNKAITCYDGGSDPPSEGTTRHEFFHAIQYNYAPISWSKLPKQRPDWIVEATAELTESTSSSASNVVRASTSLRPIDTPLTENTGKPNYLEYRAQDFWVYLIKNRSSTPADILDPVFDQQSNVPNKPTAEKVDQLYSLADDYWGWVRNQAFESQVTAGYNGKLSDPCVFDSDVASPDTITYDAGSRSSPKEEFTVASRLTARVEAVQVQTGSNRIDLEITASTSDDDSFVRAYHPYSSSTTDCWTNSEDSSHTITDIVEESSEKTYYVLVGATTIDVQRSTFSIEISHDDRLTK